MLSTTWLNLLPLNRVSAEGRVLLPDLERFLIVSALVPLIQRLHAFPLLYNRTLRRRRGRQLGSVGIQDSHADLVVIQALDGPIRFD